MAPISLAKASLLQQWLSGKFKECLLAVVLFVLFKSYCDTDTNVKRHCHYTDSMQKKYQNLIYPNPHELFTYTPNKYRRRIPPPKKKQKSKANRHH